MRLIHAVSLVRIQVPRPFFMPLWYNMDMGKRKGFTLIEITLFLAVTAALFIGIALGMQNSITQQRYNESTQEFLEFMRSIYSKVSNPQSPGKGNSNQAIYGKLVVFGEKYNIDKSPVEGNPIFTYDVVGSVVGSQNIGNDALKDMLSSLKLSLKSPEKFEMPWQTTLQNQDGTALFKGSMLVVRHPLSGTINTLYSSTVVNQNADLNNVNIFRNAFSSFGSNTTGIIFCLSPYPLGRSGPIPKQPIRILPNAKNASDVEFVDLDTTDEKLKCK